MKEQSPYPFEKNVLAFASLLGLFISAAAVLSDIDNSGLSIRFFADSGFTLIFLFVLIALKMRVSFRWILIFFYLPFVGLLVFTFYSSRGLLESLEYYIYVGLIFMIFTLKGKLPFYFSLTLLAGVIVSSILLELQFDISNNFKDQHTSDINFILSSLGIIGFTYYAKHALVQGRNTLKENRDKLQMKTLELEQKRDELEGQKEKLEKLTLVIDERASSRTQDLQNQKKRREAYLTIISSELNTHFLETIKAIDQIDEKTLEEPFFEMLKQSANSLENEMSSLKEKVIESND